MEIECTKCHRKFQSLKETDAVCPDCLRQEFARAPKLDDDERQEFRDSFRQSAKRQHARAEIMNQGYTDGTAFSAAGKIQFGLGLFIFLICGFFFYLMDGGDGLPAIGKMDRESLRLISVVLCWTAAALVATSSRRRKVYTLPLALIMVVCGWCMPNMIKYEQVVRPIVMQQVTTKGETEEKASDGPVLNNEDLQVFVQFRKTAPHRSHYAVYLDDQDTRTRAIVREAITRFLRAEYTTAYTRANGALYVACNVPGKIKNISDTLSRFGRITFANVSEGVYEVRFDAEKANLVSKYPPEVLASPLNTSFVTANIYELSSLDAMRVRMAARSLKNANVQILRREVHDAILRALSDLWDQDLDTQTSLIEALVVYAYPNDKQAIPLCHQFFENSRIQKHDIPESVTTYLVKEIPKQMIAPIMEFWFENPLVWQQYVEKLGPLKVQPTIFARLRKTKNIREINNILRYLQKFGTTAAIPEIQKFMDHSDSIIRHTARETMKALESRGS